MPPNDHDSTNSKSIQIEDITNMTAVEGAMKSPGDDSAAAVASETTMSSVVVEEQNAIQPVFEKDLTKGTNPISLDGKSVSVKEESKSGEESDSHNLPSFHGNNHQTSSAPGDNATSVENDETMVSSLTNEGQSAIQSTSNGDSQGGTAVANSSASNSANNSSNNSANNSASNSGSNGTGNSTGNGTGNDFFSGNGPFYSLPPGAYAVAGIGASTAADADADVEADVPEHVLEADTDPIHEAYTVEEDVAHEAKVVRTFCGIDRKRLFILLGIVVAAVAIILGAVLGTQKNETTEVAAPVCGPLCGIGLEEGATSIELPFPERKAFKRTCSEWEFDAMAKLIEEDTDCVGDFAAAALSCGCPSIEIPTDYGCGPLCTDGAELPDPERFYRDIHFMQYYCRDFEALSLFEKDEQECVNYNAMGAVCGCEANTPHPDACGSLCGPDPEDVTVFLDPQQTQANFCHVWDTISSFLPSWYNNPNDETCADYWADIAHGCTCKNQPRPGENCGQLCTQQRYCPSLCLDGSSVPDFDALAHNTDCLAWEFLARSEQDSAVCPLYAMAGYQCGCNNSPPENACGPLCGPDTVIPDPDKVVKGKKCEDWDVESRFLFEGFGAPGYQLFTSCKESFEQVAFGCGCFEDLELESVCGSICKDGKTLVDPEQVVDDVSCGDLDFFSLFETYADRCIIYEDIGKECRCTGDPEVEISSEPVCFDPNSNSTYYYAPYAAIAGRGTHAYVLQLGESGYVSQIGGGGWQGDVYILGWHSGEIETTKYDNKTSMTMNYGGGTSCRVHGPRSTKVRITEDDSVMKPTITTVYEPAVCVYQVDMKVPSFCDRVV